MKVKIAATTLFALLLGGSMALSSGNPADMHVASAPQSEEPAGVEMISGEDEPEVQGVFDEDIVEDVDSKSGRVDRFFNGLSSENLKERVTALYASNVKFSSPLASVSGQDALLQHYTQLFAGVKSFNLEITEEFISGQETVLLWQATYTHDALNGGQQVKLDGVSHLTFAGDAVVIQRDYYDLGAAVYEHVTLIGRLVRWVKGRVNGV